MAGSNEEGTREPRFHYQKASKGRARRRRTRRGGEGYLLAGGVVVLLAITCMMIVLDSLSSPSLPSPPTFAATTPPPLPRDTTTTTTVATILLTDSLLCFLQWQCNHDAFKADSNPVETAQEEVRDDEMMTMDCDLLFGLSWWRW